MPSKICIHHWHITETYPDKLLLDLNLYRKRPFQTLSVKQKNVICKDENGKEYLGETKSVYESINSDSNKGKYFRMKAVCQKCGEYKDVGVDQRARDTYENSVLYKYTKPKKLYGYNEDFTGIADDQEREELKKMHDNNEDSPYLSDTKYSRIFHKVQEDESGEKNFNTDEREAIEEEALRAAVFDDVKHDFGELLDDHKYAEEIRGELEKQDKEYLQIWDGFITRHQKGRSLIHNTVYIKNRSVLEDKVFPIVRNILQNYSRQEKFTMITTFPEKDGKIWLTDGETYSFMGLNGKMQTMQYKWIRSRSRNKWPSILWLDVPEMSNSGVVDLTPHNAIRLMRGEIDKILPTVFDNKGEWLNKYLVHATIDNKDRLLQWGAPVRDGKKCKKCGGTGHYKVGECDSCHGWGEVEVNPKPKTLKGLNPVAERFDHQIGSEYEKDLALAAAYNFRG